MKIKRNKMIKKSKCLSILLFLMVTIVSCDETYTYIMVDNSLPVAGYTVTVNNLTVNFTNKSTDATGYIWDFGDGATSTELNPQHIYAQKGKYMVKLTASDNNNVSDISSQEVPVGFPLASFTYVTDKLKVTYTNTSANASSYSWNFGDGTSSTETNPVHVFPASGKYTVTLTAIDGTDENSYNADISVVGKTIPIILNPSFELTDRTMWAVPPATSTYTASQSPIPPDGPNGAKLGNTSQYLDQTLVVDANEDYTITYWFCSKFNTGGGLMKITNAAGTTIKDADASATATNEYVERSVSFNTGSNTSIRIRCEFVATEIRFDMFTIR